MSKTKFICWNENITYLSIEMSIKVHSLSNGDYLQFSSSETFSGRSSDHVLQLYPDDGMTAWGVSTLGILLCAQSKRSFQWLLVAEDALRCGDIWNGPRSAPLSLWLTDQLWKPVLSRNSPDALWSHGFPLILKVPRCTELSVSQPYFFHWHHCSWFGNLSVF